MLNLSSSFKKINRFFTFTGEERRLFIEAWVYMLLARYRVKHKSFAELKRYIGKEKTLSPVEVTPDVHEALLKVRWAIDCALLYSFGDNKCLIQALSGAWMLDRRHIPSTIYLGVRKDANEKLIAHAWLRCGQMIVTGGGNLEFFTTVAYFSNGQY